MTNTTNEFFQTHAPSGDMNPQQAAQLLELAMGDTGSTPDNGGAPSDTPEADQGAAAWQGNEEGQPGVKTPAADPDPANTVVLAKDGVHTIAYQKLVDARAGEQHWKSQAAAAQQQLEALQQQAEQRANAGQAPTATDNAAAAAAAAIENGVDPEIFGDYSEEALAKGIRTLVNAQVSQMTEKMRGELSQLVQPLQQKQATDATQAHYQTIYEKHPDADSIAESKELADWIAKQPSFARAGYESVLQKGNAAEIVEFFDQFKSATGKTQQPAVDPKAAARAAIANMAPTVPASLTDIPGGRAGAVGRMEALDQLNAVDQLEAMQGMNPQQIEAYLNRQL